MWFPIIFVTPADLMNSNRLNHWFNSDFVWPEMTWIVIEKKVRCNRIKRDKSYHPPDRLCYFNCTIGKKLNWVDGVWAAEQALEIVETIKCARKITGVVENTHGKSQAIVHKNRNRQSRCSRTHTDDLVFLTVIPYFKNNSYDSSFVLQFDFLIRYLFTVFVGIFKLKSFSPEKNDFFSWNSFRNEFFLVKILSSENV